MNRRSNQQRETLARGQRWAEFCRKHTPLFWCVVGAVIVLILVIR
jgi:hypothetical protein